MNIEKFRVETLDEITPYYFKMAAVACMAEEEHLAGLLGVPCGGEIVLYQYGKAQVKIRNWSSMLELYVSCINGTWLVCSHIEGRGLDKTIDEAYRQFLEAKPFIKKNCERAFSATRLSEDAHARWLKNTEPVMEDIKRFLTEEDDMEAGDQNE